MGMFENVKKRDRYGENQGDMYTITERKLEPDLSAVCGCFKRKNAI